MREKLIELIENAPVWRNASFDEACTQVAGHLIANGVTVREKGEWIPQDSTYTRFMCSACGSKNHEGGQNYCPNCGADMRPDDTMDGDT